MAPHRETRPGVGTGPASKQEEGQGRGCSLTRLLVPEALGGPAPGLGQAEARPVSETQVPPLFPLLEVQTVLSILFPLRKDKGTSAGSAVPSPVLRAPG